MPYKIRRAAQQGVASHRHSLSTRSPVVTNKTRPISKRHSAPIIQARWVKSDLSRVPTKPLTSGRQLDKSTRHNLLGLVARARHSYHGSFGRTFISIRNWYCLSVPPIVRMTGGRQELRLESVWEFLHAFWLYSPLARFASRARLREERPQHISRYNSYRCRRNIEQHSAGPQSPPSVVYENIHTKPWTCHVQYDILYLSIEHLCEPVPLHQLSDYKPQHGNVGSDK
jgi:hypothetical protein